MDLYLDTEFNGHGGKLISLALASPEGKHWYSVHPGHADVCSDTHPWVKENVLPLLWEMPTTLDPYEPDHAVFVASLREYLLSRSGATIWADWPDDFAHLMRLMSGPSYDQSWMIPCTMQLIVTPPGQPTPKMPHNALSDAIALMEWHQAQLKSL